MLINNIMRNQDIGLSRNTQDKFYTIPSISKLCLDYYKQHVNIDDDDLCIEPSAGNGSFISSILDNFKKYKFYDIEPKNEDIETLDFLKDYYEDVSITTMQGVEEKTIFKPLLNFS